MSYADPTFAKDLKASARAIFDAAMADCSIDQAVDRALKIASDSDGTHLLLDGNPFLRLDTLRHLRIVSAGKAAAAMLTSLLARLPLPPACNLEAVLVAPEPPPGLPAAIQYFPGGHPVPNAASFAAATAALALMHDAAHRAPEDTLCLFLLSGGASAMMELPLDPSISLADTIAFHQALVLSGASIVEINCVRKHFSAIKGGRLALAAGAARKLTLLVSDVPPGRLDALASGPTLPDPTTVAECREIVSSYKLLDRFPAPVARFFTQPGLPETPKPFQLHSPSCKLLDSDELARRAQDHAARLDFHAVIDNTCDDWSYDDAANYLLARLRSLRRDHPRVCLISAGEVTVQVPQLDPHRTHIGGRNQHFALYAATLLRPQDAPLAILSAGSDGIDGNSPATGAIVDEQTLSSCSLLENAIASLADFDAYTWLHRAGATIVTGPTGHNLRDLRILLADESGFTG